MQELKKGHGGTLLTGLCIIPCSACFHSELNPPCCGLEIRPSQEVVLIGDVPLLERGVALREEIGQCGGRL